MSQSISSLNDQHMLKLLMTMLYKYTEEDLSRLRRTEDPFTIVMYDVKIKDSPDESFTRIDIFTRLAKPETTTD